MLRAEAQPWVAWPLTIPMGAGVFISQALTAFAALALSRRYHLPAAQAGVWVGAMVLVCGVLGSQIGGQVATRTRRPGGLVLAIPLLVAGVAAYALARSATPPSAVASMAVIILALSVLAPLGLDHLQRSTAPEQRGRVLSSYLSAATLFAIGLGPVSVGMVSVHVVGRGATMTAICWVVMAVAVIGTVSAVGLRRPT